MAGESYAVVRVRLEAKIGSHTFDDVVQYASGFAMNDIPTASIMVAVGRNVKTDKLATIHTAVNELRSVTMPAYVWLLVQTLDKMNASSGLEVVSEKKILIFEGDAVGTGWQRSTTGAQFTIHILHWLARLNYTSAVSASSHPGNPSDWTYPAIHRAIGLGSGESTGTMAGDPSWVPMINKGSINEAALRDIWGNALHSWMTHIANDDPVDLRLKGGQKGGGSVTVIDALKRIGPNGDGKPLNVELGGADAAIVAEGLRQALQAESGNSWINTTLWGKLIGEWSPAYWFAVIPRVSDALIVPFTGGLSGDHWAKIGDEDYAQCDINAQLRQVLRAVGIVHPVTWQTGANLNAGAIAENRGGMCGWYQPEKLDQGMVLLKDAPSWLAQPLFESAFSLYSQAADGQGTVGTEVDDKQAGQPQKPERDLAETQKKQRGIMDNYAHQWYTIECLKGRTGELAGKLRFDIAPGSNIFVEAGSSRNVPQSEDGLAVDIYATVTRVTYVINAETQQAGTGFSLAHIRTKAENENEITSTAKPPLYTEAWRGAVLHKDFTPKK